MPARSLKTWEQKAVQYQLQQLEPLVGGTITELVEANNGEFYLPAFRVRDTKGKLHLVCLLADEEGNGPGAVLVDA